MGHTVDVKLRQVQTMYGPGLLMGKLMDGTGWMVTFKREDFTPEEWKKLSPFNGPCVNKVVWNDEIMGGI